MANDWLKHIPFINRKYRDARLNNAKNVPWSNQQIKTNIPESVSNQQLRDVYKQRVRQNLRSGTPADPAFPWQERTRMPSTKPTPPKGTPTPNSPAQLKRLVEGLQKAKPPQGAGLPLPRGITIPKVPINIPPGLVKAAGVGGTIYQLASEAPKTWKAIESLGVDIWSIITSGAGLVPDIARQPWWQDFAKAVVERKRQLQQEQGLIRPSSQLEVQPATYPFTGGQSAVQYQVTAAYKYWYQSNQAVFNAGYYQGPISGIVYEPSGDTNVGPDGNRHPAYKARIVYAGGARVTLGDGFLPQFGDYLRIVSLVRGDGQPDTGGNPPPTTAPITSEPWIPVPVTPIPVSDLIPSPVTPTTTEEEQKLPSPFGGIPFIPYSIPIPSEGVNEGLAPSKTPLTPNSPSVDDQTAPTKIITTTPASTPTQTPQKEEERKKSPGTIPFFLPLFTPVRNGSKPSNQIAPKTPEPTPTTTPALEECQICNQPIINNQEKIINNQNTLLNGLNTIGQGIDLSVLKVINDKLGDQLDGGISGYFKRAWQTTRMDKIINYLTLIMAIHNAAMLSRNLAVTLGDTASQVIRVLGITDHEGKFIDVNAFIGDAATGLFKAMLGEEVYQGISKKWNLANRIISSATNIIWTIRSIADSTREILEWTAENTGKIGNALKRWGIVGNNAYNWMPEQVTSTNAWMRKVDRFRQGVDSLDDAASSFSGALGEVQNIQEEFNQLDEQKKQFDKNLKELTPKQREDNEPVKTQATTELQESTSPNIDRGDLIKPEG